MQLIRYDAACKAIAECKAVDEVKDWRDKAAALQAYAKQAQNKEMEVDCAEIRIRAERRLGTMIRDGQAAGELATRGQPKEMSSVPTLTDMGVSRDLSSRAQAIASIPEDEFEQTLAEHRDEQEAVTGRTMEKLARSGIGMGFNNRGDIEYYTPVEYTDAARRVFGGKIDLDPASCLEANTKYVKAAKFYTKDDDGLAQPWKGSVWCNPPYGGGAQAFAERALTEFDAGNIKAAIFLLNGHSNGSSWFYPLWEYPLCFTSKRIKFHVPEGAPDADAGPTANSVIVYIGNDADRFRDEFKRLGFVVRRY